MKVLPAMPTASGQAPVLVRARASGSPVSLSSVGELVEGWSAGDAVGRHWQQPRVGHPGAH